ncbi:hypothetical protein NLJ89_g6185 [Agrocybe chaxingu]|uniref:Uncharacterized protein n=1 Tax=Agrocybe chaxingu TaxID=84603 RepID=A0A9W8MWN5_9AGAR|nr:hypothetical protein NLJ89_g6185 [Agrocybe chaxingu]
MASASANAMSARASSKSPEPALGFSVPDQMEVDRPGSRGRPEDPFVLASPAHASLSSDFEQALIPPTSSASRLPTTVPSSVTSAPTSHQSHVAISAQQNIDYNTYASQDVHHFVNSETSSSSSPATRTFGQPSTHETSVSSFPPPITQHGLNHPIRRPRTSTVFSSATDLAAHYGIPQRLPPAPRTTPRQQPPAPKPAQVYPDFQTLSANYLNMLSNKPTDNTMAATSTTNVAAPAAAVTTADLNAPLIPTNAEDHLRDIAAMLGHG